MDWEHDGPKIVSRLVGHQLMHLCNQDLIRNTLSRQTSTVQRRERYSIFNPGKGLALSYPESA